MKKTNTKLLLILLIFVFFSTTGAKCGGLPAGALKEGKPTPVTLNYWSVFNESDFMRDLIDKYQKENPYVTINFKNYTAAEYQNQLLNALAEDRGPDIFSVQTTWMRAYVNKIAPMPDQITMMQAFEAGSIQKITYTRANVKPGLTVRNINDLFPEVVVDNQIISNKIYGLPLSLDNLALFYNRDLLNNAGISAPPANWSDFSDQVSRLTKKDDKGNIIQAGAAIGTANNISRATDILSLLMMQSGVQMVNADGQAAFSHNPSDVNSSTLLSATALNFYNSFASPSSENYTWDNDQPDALQAFIEGKAAFYLGYAYDIPLIQTQAPKLNFNTAPIPQLNQPPVNFANYWAETVSAKSKHQNEAWDFIAYITTNADINKLYITKSQTPVALRSLIDWQKNQSGLNLLAPFDDQLLTSRSWYQGKDEQAAESIFKTLINSNLQATAPTEKLINDAATQINQTL